MIPLRHLLRNPTALFWGGLFVVTWLLSQYSWQLYKALDARWIVKYPTAWRLPLEKRISDAMQWLVEDASFGLFTFRDLTRFLATLIETPYDWVRNLLIDGFHSGIGQNAVEIAPSLSWIAIIVTLAAMGHYARNWALAALMAGCFLYLAVFGQWISAMATLASVLIAVPVGAAGGLFLGIAAYRWPMVRVTTVALQNVPDEIHDVGMMVGCTPRQLLWRIKLPMAFPELLLGLNQIIMLALSMLVITALVGTRDLGQQVYIALTKADTGQGIVAGLSVAFIAIIADRILSAAARHTRQKMGLET